MDKISDCEIFSARMLCAPVAKVYQAFADPTHLKNWWGPKGFTNTIHEFDLRPGGKWTLTMHGPEKGNYENSSVFTSVQPFTRIAWTRVSKPLFDMEVAFDRLDDARTRISFRMIFKTPEESEKIRRFAVPNNEENFDRLEQELSKMQ